MRQRELLEMGYRVLVVWECELENENQVRQKIARLAADVETR